MKQALADAKKFTPEYIAEVKRVRDTTRDAGEFKRYSERYIEASDNRDDILSWVGTSDFATVVDWAGLDPESVAESFNEVIAAQTN